jgi:hypothetical protein
LEIANTPLETLLRLTFERFLRGCGLSPLYKTCNKQAVMLFNEQRKLMKRLRFPLLWSLAALAIGASTSTGQTGAPALQSAPRPAAANVVRGTNVRPSNATPSRIVRGAENVGQRPSGALPTQLPNQLSPGFRSAYPRFPRQLNPRPRVITQRQDTGIRYTPPSANVIAKNDVTENQLPLARVEPNANANAQGNLTQREDGIVDGLSERVARQTREKAKWHNGNDNKHRNYFDALRAHRHEWHDRNWWKGHCNTIVFVTGGYYFLDAGYWYPAWGYDPVNSYYDYDGPIYTYGDLLPDQVIANVQAALQDAGYYFGAITGSLSVETRAALANYQRDLGLVVTAVIDEPTVESLGLY